MKYYVMFVFLLTLGLGACDDGPAKELGEDIDNAAKDLGNVIEDACEEVTNRPC